MGLGPDLSAINPGAIRGAAHEHGQAGLSVSGLADQLEGVQSRTALSWQGPAASAFSVHIGRRVQATRLAGQVLQQESSLLNTYADQLQSAKRQWESGLAQLKPLPVQLQSQVLGGGELSLAGLSIPDPVTQAALLAQAGEALAQMTGAQVKAPQAGLQLAEGLMGLQGLVDELQSLVSGNQSHVQSAAIAPGGPPQLRSAGSDRWMSTHDVTLTAMVTSPSAPPPNPAPSPHSPSPPAPTVQPGPSPSPLPTPSAKSGSDWKRYLEAAGWFALAGASTAVGAYYLVDVVGIFALYATIDVVVPEGAPVEIPAEAVTGGMSIVVIGAATIATYYFAENGLHTLDPKDYPPPPPLPVP